MHSSQILIFPNLSQIISPFKAILLDAYGVFWGGNATGLIPGAKQVMEELVLKGKIIGILSNSTQLALKEMEKLERYGVIQGQHFHFLVTSGDVAREIFLNQSLPFNTNSPKFWVLGDVHPRFSSHTALFQGTIYEETTNIDEAGFIYTGIPHIKGEDQVDPELFREGVAEVLEKKLPLICPNPDRFAHEGNPPKAVVRQGSIAAIYEELGGTVFYIGKPYPAVFVKAMEYFIQKNILHDSEILMVGDTPETDIRGARQFGIPSALTLQTGIMGDRIRSMGQQVALKNLSDLPDYYIEKFASH